MSIWCLVRWARGRAPGPVVPKQVAGHERGSLRGGSPRGFGSLPGGARSDRYRRWEIRVGCLLSLHVNSLRLATLATARQERLRKNNLFVGLSCFDWNCVL